MLGLMLFFPSVTFGLLSAEIFPWATFYASARLRSIDHRVLPIAIVFTISIVSTSLTYDGQYFDETIRAALAYINPLLVFMVLAKTSEREIQRLVKILKYALITLLTLGILQFSGLIQFADPIFKALIPRGSAEVFGGARGISLLSTEPSRAAFEVIFLYASWRTLSELSAAKLIILDILFTIFIIGMLKSTTGLTVLLVYLIFIHRSKIIILFLLLAPIFVYLFAETRAINVALELLSKTSPFEAYEFLIDASGFRLVSILSAYYYGLTNFFGGGIGAWPVTSVEAMLSAGFSPGEINYFIFHADSEFSSIRPTSYLANVALDMGLLGTLCMIFLLIPYIKCTWTDNISIRPLLLLFLFSLFFIGAVGNPVPWVALMLATRYTQIKRAASSYSLNSLRAQNLSAKLQLGEQ